VLEIIKKKQPEIQYKNPQLKSVEKPPKHSNIVEIRYSQE
jgi:hypothetical protein